MTQKITFGPKSRHKYDEYASGIAQAKAQGDNKFNSAPVQYGQQTAYLESGESQTLEPHAGASELGMNALLKGRRNLNDLSALYTPDLNNIG